MNATRRAAEVLTGAEARAQWRAIADAVPMSVGRMPVWFDLICASGRYVDATRAYEFPDGRVVVLPLVRRRSTPQPIGLYESPPLGWDLGADTGGLVSAGSVTPQHVEAVAADLAALPAARVRVWPGARHEVFNETNRDEVVADLLAWIDARLAG